MSASVTFRVDRELPASLTRSPAVPGFVAIDLFDPDRLEAVVAALEGFGAVIVSAVSVGLGLHPIACWDDPSPDWVAGIVTSDNHEWLVDESYRCVAFDRSIQRVPPDEPLRICTGPRGQFSRLGYHFGARASFRKAVDQPPESFEYTTGEVVRKGKVLDSWSRIEPVRAVRLLSADSLGNLSTTAHTYPFRSSLLWMGDRAAEDFGFVWDELGHGAFEQERCALVPVSVARRLTRKFPGDFLADPVLDRESATARRAVEVFRMICDRLPMEGWR